MPRNKSDPDGPISKHERRARFAHKKAEDVEQGEPTEYPLSIIPVLTIEKTGMRLSTGG
jgi:hypothetical protein